MVPIHRSFAPKGSHRPDKEDWNLLADTLPDVRNSPRWITDFGDLDVLLQTTITVTQPRIRILLAVLRCRSGSEVVEEAIQNLRIILGLIVTDQYQVAAILQKDLGIFLHAINRLKTVKLDCIVGNSSLMK